MKTDRELLELAAKAAGYDYAKHGGYIVVDGIPGNWNPLTDDGDALRLAVKLGIGTIHHLGWGQVFQPSLEHRIDFVYDGDALAATRRAIVRAAAVIGASL
jgi:hypothetical protein